MPFCAICEQAVAAWLPHPQYRGGHEFTQLVGGVGSDPQHYACPNCQSTDLERHAWLYLSARGIPQRLQGQHVLHIGARLHLEQPIRRCRPAEYNTVDLAVAPNPTETSRLCVDPAALPYADEFFDLIICNQQLNLIPDVVPLLAELARCLKPAGQLLAQTFYAPHLKYTLELVDPVPSAVAAILFGHDDGVRLFGGDIGDLFRGAGLVGELIPHAAVLPGHDALEYGCNAQEPLFLFSKNPCPSSQS
jgi:SAM-dependent methyltransferase